MTESLTSANPLLVTIILATLAIGLPILVILSIRALWDRNVSLGRSKELEKLIWQLHRIASALEYQMNLSFPAVQPGTEEPRDLAYLQRAAPSNAASPGVATPSAAPLATSQSQAKPLETSAPAAQQPSAPPPVLREPSAEPHRAGVNSMFGF